MRASVTLARSSARYFAALAATNLKAALALRGSFWLQASFMLLNNLTFFITWIIFFDRFGNVRGWRLEDTAVLFGVVAGGVGLFGVLAHGGARLSQIVFDGELDPMLVQPKPPLLQAIGSRTVASGWGDFATGVFFLAIAGWREPAVLPFAVLGLVASAVVFTSTAVIVHSLAFWLGQVETLARQVWEFQLNFSLYPSTIFGGGLRVVLFTIIPAGFSGFLPAELVRDPALMPTLALLGGVAVYVALAVAVFSRGLRWYESGSRFGGVW